MSLLVDWTVEVRVLKTAFSTVGVMAASWAGGRVALKEFSMADKLADM